MQMYAGLPVITNKITPSEQQGIPHHLIGNVSLEEEPWTVGHFKSKAEGIIKEIRSRGRLPILVGGTHYYTQSLLFEDSLVGDSNEKAADGAGDYLKREEISKKFPILEASTEEILEKLREVDPVMADRWHPNDRRKIQRSLEIYLTQGKKASDVYAEQRERKSAPNKADFVTNISISDPTVSLSSTLLFWVHADPEILKSRLDARVDKMLQQGLISEVQTLDKFQGLETVAGRVPDRTSGIWVSIGFKEFSSYLSALANPAASEKDIEKALALSIEQTKAATRQYAKRQVRWIRLKLLTALKAAGSLKNLYLLDGSDVSQFACDVADPAIKICGEFLKGEELPEPTSMSPIAAELLVSEREFDLGARPDLWVRQTCEVCNTTAVTEEQWKLHLQSRGHRGKLRKLNKPPRQVGAAPPDPILDTEIESRLDMVDSPSPTKSISEDTPT
jgi:tRNA dimethylallyltransferase